MPLIALGVAFLVVILALLLMPLTLVQRYRVGTARRPARGWVAAVNLVGLGMSAALFLAGAAVTSWWVPGAFGYSVIGLAGGGVLGLLGLALTKWEPSGRVLHYTPDRWLVLGITLVSRRGSSTDSGGPGMPGRRDCKVERGWRHRRGRFPGGGRCRPRLLLRLLGWRQATSEGPSPIVRRAADAAVARVRAPN